MIFDNRDCRGKCIFDNPDCQSTIQIVAEKGLNSFWFSSGQEMFGHNLPRSKDASQSSVKPLIDRACDCSLNHKIGTLGSSGNNLAGFISFSVDSFDSESDNRDQEDNKSGRDFALGESELPSKPGNSLFSTETMLDSVKQETVEPESDLSLVKNSTELTSVKNSDVSDLVLKSEELSSVKNSDQSDEMLKSEEPSYFENSDLSPTVKQEPEDDVHDGVLPWDNCSDIFVNEQGYNESLKKEIEDIKSDEGLMLTSEIPSSSKSVIENQCVQPNLMLGGLLPSTANQTLAVGELCLQIQKTDPVGTAFSINCVSDLSYTSNGEAQNSPVKNDSLRCVSSVPRTPCRVRRESAKNALETWKVLHKENRKQNSSCSKSLKNSNVADRMVSAVDKQESGFALEGVIPLPANIINEDPFFGVTVTVKPCKKMFKDMIQTFGGKELCLEDIKKKRQRKTDPVGTAFCRTFASDTICTNKSKAWKNPAEKGDSVGSVSSVSKAAHTMKKELKTKALKNSLQRMKVVHEENGKQNTSCSKSSENLNVADRTVSAIDLRKQESSSTLEDVIPLPASISNEESFFGVTAMVKPQRKHTFKNKDQTLESGKMCRKRQRIGLEDLDSSFALLEGVIPLPASLTKRRRGRHCLTEEEKQIRKTLRQLPQSSGQTSKPNVNEEESCDSSDENNHEEIFESIEDLGTQFSESKTISLKPVIKDGSVFSLELIAEILQTTVDQLDSRRWRKDIDELEDVKLFRKIVRLGDELRRYKCYKCGIQVHGTSQDMKSHMRELHGDAPLGFGCFFCPLARPTEKHLMAHERAHIHWNRKGTCVVCDLTHHSTNGIDWSSLHAKCHPPIDELRLMKPEEQAKVHEFCHASNCPATSKPFADAVGLTTHAAAYHLGGNEVCIICGKDGMSVHGLRRHSRTCIGKKEKMLRMCGMCGLKGKRLSAHDCSGKYDCKVCDAKFKNYHSLRRHTLDVHAQKEHICDLCGEAFAEKMVLEDHVRKHTNARPYQCPVCEGWYTSKQSLGIHARLYHKLTAKQMREKYSNADSGLPVVSVAEEAVKEEVDKQEVG